ncbi:tetratricopeptide repeat protein [Aspergillus tanneri]|uniref:Kinesin light chain n=1 Tax=Aspergillus tanneri TaxID=1220188 RepID=A0A5M9MAG4_9EURO|nr:uncharacterized protein ATNIH1004_008239 [Aspergillus tanneri]KAA8644042.1 hypothetical protein ATNIH1004_008239 [Aspergillus tanneri]
MACVDPRNIPESFLPRSASKKMMIDALGLLSAYGFITIQPGNGSITLHRLVYLETRSWMKKEEQFLSYIRKASDRLNEIIDNDHINRQLWRETCPTSYSYWSVETCLDSDGRYKEAEKLLLQVMEIQKQVLRPEHPDTLTSMANLASTYWNQGRWTETDELEVQAMEARKQVLGPEHADTSTLVM